MNELEIEILQKILQDRPLLNAIKKLFYCEINKNSPVINDSVDNQLIGEKYRAYKEAHKLIDGCFLELENYKGDKENKYVLNKAR